MNKMHSKNNREVWKIVSCISLIIIGLTGIIYAGVMQMILCYKRFGIAISSEHFIIPHLSLLGYLGAIPLTAGNFVIKYI